MNSLVGQSNGWFAALLPLLSPSHSLASLQKPVELFQGFGWASLDVPLVEFDGVVAWLTYRMEKLDGLASQILQAIARVVDRVRTALAQDTPELVPIQNLEPGFSPQQRFLVEEVGVVSHLSEQPVTPSIVQKFHDFHPLCILGAFRSSSLL